MKRVCGKYFKSRMKECKDVLHLYYYYYYYYYYYHNH